MATLNFIVVDTRLFKMSDEERIAFIDKRAEEQKKDSKEQQWTEKNNPVNPFPKWIRELIKGLGRTTYDRFGETYTVHDIPDDEVDEKEADFKARLEQAKKDDPEKEKWFTDFHIGVRSFEVPETDAVDAAED